MKTRLLLVIAIAVLAGVVIWFSWRKAELPSRAEPEIARTSTVKPASLPAVTETETNGATAGEVLTVEPSAAPPAAVEAEMETVKVFIRDYRLALGGNPVGSNVEITKALRGANPRQAKFLTAGELPVNGAGELVDHWGTPYFFHQISGQEMEIRSAGPDQKMWTGDDLLVR